MNNGDIAGVFKELGDGYKAGCDQFGECEFSLIKIGQWVADIPTLERLGA